MNDNNSDSTSEIYEEIMLSSTQIVPQMILMKRNNENNAEENNNNENNEEENYNENPTKRINIENDAEKINNAKDENNNENNAGENNNNENNAEDENTNENNAEDENNNENNPGENNNNINNAGENNNNENNVGGNNNPENVINLLNGTVSPVNHSNLYARFMLKLKDELKFIEIDSEVMLKQIQMAIDEEIMEIEITYRKYVKKINSFVRLLEVFEYIGQNQINALLLHENEPFIMTLPSISDIPCGDNNFSETFCWIGNPYLMKLKYSNSSLESVFYVKLLLENGLFDDKLEWPFQADVTITLCFKKLFVQRNLKQNFFCKINRSRFSSIEEHLFKFENSKLMLGQQCKLICEVKFS